MDKWFLQYMLCCYYYLCLVGYTLHSTFNINGFTSHTYYLKTFVYIVYVCRLICFNYFFLFNISIINLFYSTFPFFIPILQQLIPIDFCNSSVICVILDCSRNSVITFLCHSKKTKSVKI